MDAPQRQERDLLLRVIAQGAVSVVFQPIVDTHDGLIVAYEALTRPAPTSGFHSPEDLFHAAERHGLLWDLECLTRRTALQTAANWPRDVKLFINNTPSVFADGRFATTIVEELRSHADFTSDRVVLEITEMAESSEDTQLLNQVKLAKEAGFAVAVDDAGAGTSGLNRMMILRPQWIKLDRTFCRGIDQDGLKQNLVRFFVHFARMSGVSVVAEGIENPSELATIVSLGVRFAQGYYLGKPGDRAMTLDPQFVAEVRQRWAAVDAIVPEMPQDMPLARLCRPITTVSSEQTTVLQAWAQLRRVEDHVGVAVAEGKRLIGWISRGNLELASRSTPHNPVGSLFTQSPVPLPAEATVQDGLRHAGSRDDNRMGEPILLTRGWELIGAVLIRDLMLAAATEHRSPSSLKAPLTGLPARVRADQHIEEMIGRGADPMIRQSTVFHADAAFVDLRGFSEYNSIHGYDLGDRLIREVGEMLQRVAGLDDNVFIAHLSDDRFLLTARAGTLHTRLQGVVQEFDRRPDAARNGTHVGLRVLLMPDIFESARHPRDVYRQEQIMRQDAKFQERSLPAGRSMVLVQPQSRRYITRQAA